MAFMKGEEKQLLLDRYLDIEWPADVSDLRCVRCDRVVIIHYVSNCQHLFCNNCRRVFSDGGRWKCPKCQEYVTQLDDQDLDVEFKIHKMTISCPNKKYGCKYEEQLRKIPSHLITCKDTREAALPVEYSGENRTDAVVSQLINVNAAIGELKEGMKEMKDKVEERFNRLERKSDEIDSKFNALIERVDSLEKKSQDVDVERELASKKYAEESVFIRSQLESMDNRINEKESFLQLMMKKMSFNIEETKTKIVTMTEEMKTHNDKVKVQERQMSEVNAAQLGLAQRMARIEITEDRTREMNSATKNTKEKLQSIKSIFESIDQRIRQNESLLKQTRSNVEEMRMKMASMTQQQDTLQNKIQLRSEELNPPKAETYEWIIRDVKKTISQDDSVIESEVFRFIGYQYDIKAKIEKKKNGMTIRLQFENGGIYNKFLNKYGFTGFKYTIRDQSNSQEEKNIYCEANLQFDAYTLPYGWIVGRGLPPAMLSPPYLKDDCIKITISFEPPSIDRSFVSNNGVLMWTVDNYKLMKQEQFYRDIRSPTFYTSPRGYRVKTRLIIYNTEPMKIEIYFLTGEHDDSLSFDFPHTTTVTLFNQSDPSKDLIKSEQRNDVTLYSVELESGISIEENDFIKNDSLLFKIVIESQDCKSSNKQIP